MTEALRILPSLEIPWDAKLGEWVLRRNGVRVFVAPGGGVRIYCGPLNNRVFDSTLFVVDLQIDAVFRGLMNTGLLDVVMAEVKS